LVLGFGTKGFWAKGLAPGLDNQPHPIPYEIEWSILALAHAKPFDPVTGVCRLCLLEAYYITFDPENCTLNTREEFWGSCPHRAKFLLSKQKC